MAIRWREVRVFISSTFRDMQAERDYLVKVVFPRLRQRLEPHRIHFIDIDLRWGVTREQSDNDLALELCLQQIDECRPEAGDLRPFFIGMLGERYGYVPETVRTETLQRYDWIPDYPGHSITALEIIHGVLLNPPMHGQSFFYFRDPAFMADVPIPIRETILDAESVKAAEKQEALKQRVLDSDIPCMENYPCEYAGLRLNWRLLEAHLDEGRRAELEAFAADGVINTDEWDRVPAAMQRDMPKLVTVMLDGLEEFGRQVEDDLWQGIADQYPEILQEPAEAELDTPAVERDAHERFAESRLRIYVGRGDIHTRLCEYLDGDAREPLFLSGPSGSGKSAILARLAAEYPGARPEAFVLPHFIGATASSTSVPSMLRRLCRELQERFELSGEIPGNDTELAGTFRAFLGMAPETERIAIIIDALDQLDARDREMGLHWLPDEFPANIKLVVSCLDDPGGSALLEELTKRGHLRVQVEPLTDADCEAIIDRVPALSAKALDAEQRRMLLENPATRNPLYLQVALEELRGFGSFELLDDRIEQFRSAEDVEALFGQVLERVELDLGSALTEGLACLLAASRAGLSEAELTDMLTDTASAEDMQVVLQQLRPYLQRRGELIDFYHLALQRAIVGRYWAWAGDPSWHLCLADYFDTGHVGPRMLAELPWQLAEAGGWRRLYDLLADVEFFNALWDFDVFETKSYWSQVEANSKLEKVAAYRPVLEAPGGYDVWRIANLLNDTGHPDEALRLQEHLAARHGERGEEWHRAVALGRIADILQARGEFDAALRLRRGEELALYKRLGDARSRAITIGKIADILHIQGERDAALRIRREEELPVYEYLGDARERAMTIGKIADTLQARGELDAALRLRREQELPVYERVGDVRERAVTMSKIADILYTRGELDEALRIHREEQLPVFERLGDVRSHAVTMGKVADILYDRGELEEALRIRREEELPVYERLGDVEQRAVTMGAIADIFHSRGEAEEALRIYENDVVPVFERLGDVEQRAIAMGKIADTLHDCGRSDEALRIHREEEVPVYERLGALRLRAVTMGQIANILHARGELDEALRIRREEELPVYERLGDVRELVVGRVNLALCLLARDAAGNRNEAVSLLRQSLADATRLQLREAEQIAGTLRQIGEEP
ncbi:MAG TPA: hypothetical protein DGT21_20165 [Armatimonadetes bacterium]|nr:hypothetical protein [Armatimonadota bacterium]